jgi:hypothetical protein
MHPNPESGSFYQERKINEEELGEAELILSSIDGVLSILKNRVKPLYIKMTELFTKPKYANLQIDKLKVLPEYQAEKNKIDQQAEMLILQARTSINKFSSTRLAEKWKLFCKMRNLDIEALVPNMRLELSNGNFMPLAWIKNFEQAKTAIQEFIQQSK